MSDAEAEPGPGAKLFLDGEAAQSGDESGEDGSYAGTGDSSDEEPDGEDANADGFFVEGEDGEGGEAGEGDGEPGSAVGKRRKRRAQQELDDEDFALLEENTVRPRRAARQSRGRTEGVCEGRCAKGGVRRERDG